MEQPKKLHDREVEFYKKGKFKGSIKNEDPASQSLRIRYEAGNAKRAEALARSESGDPVQLLKSLISRGSFEECPALIERLMELSENDYTLRTDTLLQRARFEYLQGNWQDSIALCDSVEARDPLPDLMRMVVYQVRSNAHFELGEFEKSILDFKKLEGLSTLYPNGQIPLYAETNRVRIEARRVGVETAKALEEALWKRFVVTLPTANLDPILTLLRSRIDLKRMAGVSYTIEALASYLVAEVMGDDLYAGLAAFDLYLSDYPKLKGTEWESIMNAYRARHPRIERLYQEVTAAEPAPSETARGMQRYLGLSRGIAPALPPFREIKTLVFLNLGIRVSLDEMNVTKVNLHEKTKSILDALRFQSMEKCDFFTKVWGLKTFSILKHDTVIRTALKRAREQAQIAIRSRDLRVELDPGVLIIN